MATDLSTALNHPTTAARQRPFYTRVSALGFGLVALAGVAVLVAGLLAGDVAANAGFGLAFIVIGLLVAALIWRVGRATLFVAGGLAFLLLALLVPFSLFNLAHPESAPDFVPLVLTVAGLLLGLIGCVAAGLEWRRGTGRAKARPGELWALGGLLGVTGAAVLLSVVLTLAGHTSVSAEAKAGATSVQMKDFAFAPGTMQVSPGQTVRLVVRNADATLHTFTLPAAGVDVSVPPGAERVIEFKAPAAGVYQWFCIPHSTADGATRTGMVGTLRAP
ncbi:MAG: cupredoxin domain-containing protein [Anaerolineales bacterium]